MKWLYLARPPFADFFNSLLEDGVHVERIAGVGQYDLLSFTFEVFKKQPEPTPSTGGLAQLTD